MKTLNGTKSQSSAVHMIPCPETLDSIMICLHQSDTPRVNFSRVFSPENRPSLKEAFPGLCANADGTACPWPESQLYGRCFSWNHEHLRPLCLPCLPSPAHYQELWLRSLGFRGVSCRHINASECRSCVSWVKVRWSRLGQNPFIVDSCGLAMMDENDLDTAFRVHFR